jgi:hypothetical protein
MFPFLRCDSLTLPPNLHTEIPEFRTLRNQASQLRLAILEVMVRLGESHPDWIKNVDARSTCFQSLWNVARYAELSLHFLGNQLTDPGYWATFRGPTYPKRQIEFEIMAYSQCAKAGTFHVAFAAAENSHRSFLRALDPDAASAARGEYKNVYEALFRTHLRAPEDDLTLLDLLRLVRNTIHNEGVHRPRGIGRTDVVFRGVSYSFEDEKPIEFVTWGFVLDRLENLVDLHERAVHTRILASLAYIPDASAEVLPPATD